MIRQPQLAVFVCPDYKKLTEIDEARCLDCDDHLECFPWDEETKKLMGDA